MLFDCISRTPSSLFKCIVVPALPQNVYFFKLIISGDITEGALDLAMLFDHGLLRDAASKIK